MAFDVVERTQAATDSIIEKPSEVLEYYCESEDDIKDLPTYPQIRVGSRAVIVNDSGIAVCVLMRSGWKGPF